PRPRSTHRERRAYDARVTEPAHGLETVLHRVTDRRLCHLCAEILDDLLERLTVLAAVDGLDGCTDQLYAIALQHTRLVEGDRSVEGSLTTQRGQQRVG